MVCSRRRISPRLCPKTSPERATFGNSSPTRYLRCRARQCRSSDTCGATHRAESGCALRRRRYTRWPRRSTGEGLGRRTQLRPSPPLWSSAPVDAHRTGRTVLTSAPGSVLGWPPNKPDLMAGCILTSPFRFSTGRSLPRAAGQYRLAPSPPCSAAIRPTSPMRADRILGHRPQVPVIIFLSC